MDRIKHLNKKIKELDSLNLEEFLDEERILDCEALKEKEEREILYLSSLVSIGDVVEIGTEIGTVLDVRNDVFFLLDNNKKISKQSIGELSKFLGHNSKTNELLSKIRDESFIR